MSTRKNIINFLDEKDKGKVLFFAEVLFKHSKYQNLRKEIESRRKEIKENRILSHEDFWKNL